MSWAGYLLGVLGVPQWYRYHQLQAAYLVQVWFPRPRYDGAVHGAQQGGAGEAGVRRHGACGGGNVHYSNCIYSHVQVGLPLEKSVNLSRTYGGDGGSVLTASDRQLQAAYLVLECVPPTRHATLHEFTVA